MKYLIILIVILIIWTLWGHFSSRVEQADYLVIKTTSSYEIREYPAHIEAQTIIQGSYKNALNRGFSIVAGYIFGGNTKNQSIAMTAPVKEQKTEISQSESIAMTAPVKMSNQGETRTVSFVMPSSYTLQTLPTPTDTRVKIVSVPTQKVAVVRFSWYRTSARVLNFQNQLIEDLTRDGVKIVGEPSYAGYNAPGTPPWLMRNEVMIQVQ